MTSDQDLEVIVSDVGDKLGTSMDVQENAPLGRRTTMRIGGAARYFAELRSQTDVEQATAFAREKNLPLIVLGGGSNTIFDDGTIEALVVQLKNDSISIEGNDVVAGAGAYLATLINELAEKNLDLSALTGIPGSIGGAIFGNAGQGPKGIWINSFVESVTAFVDGAWKTFTKEECNFRYRESSFKDLARSSPIIWSATLHVLSKPAAEVKADVAALIKRRIETQPHLKTAGSCFKAIGDQPAWELIDAAGLRGWKAGDVQIAPQHANFLLNRGKATFADTKKLIQTVREMIPESLEVEMRLMQADGSIAS